MVARESPSAPMRSADDMVSPTRMFRSTWSLGRTMPPGTAITKTHSGLSRPLRASSMRSAASPV